MGGLGVGLPDAPACCVGQVSIGVENDMNMFEKNSKAFLLGRFADTSMSVGVERALMARADERGEEEEKKALIQNKELQIMNRRVFKSGNYASGVGSQAGPLNPSDSTVNQCPMVILLGGVLLAAAISY